MLDYTELRKKMVRKQLIKRGIEDSKVIEAFKKVPREEFVPPKIRDMAYQDAPLPIGFGQTISQPYMVAVMTQHLCLQNDSKILEIGTGSGYQSAILAEIARKVYSVEIVSKLIGFAKDNLIRLRYKNVFLIQADGTLGYKKASPYDGIIVTAGAPTVPKPLIEQLAIGSKLVIPVGTSYSQVLKVITKTKKGLEEKEICGCVFVPLIGKEGWANNEI